MFPATWGPRIFPGKTAPACCASLGGFGFFEVIYWEDLHLTIQWWKHVFCWIGFLVSCFVFPCFVHEAQGVPVNVLGHQPIDASKWMDCSSAGDQETTQANSLRMGLGYATYGVPIEWHHWHSYSSYTVVAAIFEVNSKVFDVFGSVARFALRKNSLEYKWIQMIQYEYRVYIPKQNVCLFDVMCTAINQSQGCLKRTQTINQCSM